MGRSIVLLGVLLLGGCAADRFTESDEGSTRVVTLGTKFSISLESPPSAPPGEPRIEGAFIRFDGRRSDLEPGRAVYQFSAEGVGEAEIRIRPWEYVLRVKVVPGERAPSLRSSPQDPRSY